MFVCVLPGGVGVVYTLPVPGGGCRLAAVRRQLCLQPPAHPASGHHGSHSANHPVLQRYKQTKLYILDLQHYVIYLGCCYATTRLRE